MKLNLIIAVVACLLASLVTLAAVRNRQVPPKPEVTATKQDDGWNTGFSSPQDTRKIWAVSGFCTAGGQNVMWLDVVKSPTEASAAEWLKGRMIAQMPDAQNFMFCTAIVTKE